MSRVGLAVAIVSGVVIGAPIAHAKGTDDPPAKKASKDDKKPAKSAPSRSADDKKPAKSAKTEKKSAKAETKTSKTSKKTRETKGKAAARMTSTATRSRAVTAKTRMDGGPTGFTWPPSPAMMDAEKACEARLDLAGIKYEHAERDGRIVDALVVADMTFGGVKYSNVWGSKGPHKLDCQLAVALETVGTELYALGVREVQFGSLYRWSNVRAFGKTVNVLSRHGYGLAMDIVNFIDASGAVKNVKRDYAKKDQLLLDIEKTINESHRFRILLSPRNDPASHSDHYHIEAASNFTAPAPHPDHDHDQ